jgi:hypothetical protein
LGVIYYLLLQQLQRGQFVAVVVQTQQVLPGPAHQTLSPTKYQLEAEFQLELFVNLTDLGIIVAFGFSLSSAASLKIMSLHGGSITKFLKVSSHMKLASSFYSISLDYSSSLSHRVRI